MNQSQTASKNDLNANSQPVAPLLWIGLDWADRKHYLAVLPPGASAPSAHIVEQKPEALDSFFHGLRQQYPNSRLAVCIEQSRGPVIYALMKYDFVVVYPVNPRSLADFRRSFAVSGAKSDPRDGDLLCELGAKHHQRLRPLQPEDPVTRELRLLVEARRKFVDQRTSLGLQLAAALKCYYPLLLALFSDDPCSALALAFLRRWPNLQKLKSAKAGTLRAFFYQHNCRSEEIIEKRLAAIRSAAALTDDAAIRQPFELQALSLAKMIAVSEAIVTHYDEQIARTFQSHSEASLFASLPGAGAVLAPRLAALFGTRRENWASAEEFQCWTGVAPVTKQSGKSAFVVFRRARPLFIHQTMVEYAKSSIKFCPWAQQLYQDLKRKGKGTFAAFRTLAFKWLRILFRCWKNNTPYDETCYLRSLEKRGVKLYQALYSGLSAAPKLQKTTP